MIIKKKDGKKFEQPSIVGRKYPIQELLPDNAFVYGTLDGEHGERVSTDTPRIYFIFSGSGEVEIDMKTTNVSAGDLIIIPPHTRYNYRSTNDPIVFILLMENH